ncbi:MAG: hypothetical protein ACI9EF_001066 [Pseudohongiellaceae bacterium]|jgi:hypothetical protein
MSKVLQSFGALATGWAVALASVYSGGLAGVPRAVLSSALLLLLCACVLVCLTEIAGQPQRGDGHGLRGAAGLVALGLAGLLGPLPALLVAVLWALSVTVGRREQANEYGLDALLRGLLCTALGLTVLTDFWSDRAPLARALSLGESPPVLLELVQGAAVFLVVPAMQMFLAAAICEPHRHAQRTSRSGRELLPLALTGVALASILAAVFFVAQGAPWRTHWGGHKHVGEHAVIGLAVFAALRLAVVVAENPRAPRLAGVRAASMGVCGVLLMLLSDSVFLSLPFLVGALVVGRAAAASGRRNLLKGKTVPSQGAAESLSSKSFS